MQMTVLHPRSLRFCLNRSSTRSVMDTSRSRRLGRAECDRSGASRCGPGSDVGIQSWSRVTRGNIELLICGWPSTIGRYPIHPLGRPPALHTLTLSQFLHANHFAMHLPRSVSICLEAAYDQSITNQTRPELWVIERNSGRLR